MKVLVLFALILLSITSGSAQSIEWFTLINGESFDYGIDSDVNTSGDIYSVGYSTGSTKINGTLFTPNGKGDGFIVKQNKNGEFLWGKTFGADDKNYYDEVQNVHVDTHGDCYILMTAKGKNFKYDGEVIAGIETEAQYGGAGVMLKIDPTGKLLWWKFTNIKRFESVTTDPDNNIYLTGSFYGSGTIGGQTLSNPTSGTTSDMFIAKFDSAGEMLWVKHVGGKVSNAFVHGFDIACSSDGKSVFIAGELSKTAYFETASLTSTLVNGVFLVKYDSSGTELWARTYDSGEYRTISSMDISSDGTIALAGNFGYPSSKSYTAFYNAAGELIHTSIFESTKNSKAHGISFNSTGEYFISGYFIDDVQLPDTLLTNTGGTNFMVKLGNDHKVLWLKQFPNTEWKSSIHQYTENSVIMTIRLDYPLSFNNGEDVLEPVSGDAVFMKINEEFKTSFKDDEALSSLKIYPNPVKNKLAIFGNETISKIEIGNLNGQIIDSIKLKGSTASIDVSRMQPGVYFLIATQNNGITKIVKFVKE